jgi:dTMP kinase
LSSRYSGDEAKRDLHENDFNYLLKCRDASLYVAKKLGWVVINCSDEESPFTIEEIFAKIKEVVCYS